MKTQTLKDTIENLYKVFSKYPLKDEIEGCPCCVGKQDNRVLHSKPLRELSGQDLSFYAFKAMTTFGDVEDFKHFLPRLFEIILQCEFEYNEEILFTKLNYGNWRNWTENEKSAIERFFCELFRFAVDFEKEQAYVAESFLTGVAIAVEDITSYLDLWLEEISENKIFMLKYFVIDCDYGMSNAFLADQPEKRIQIQNWLISPETVSSLENLFLQNGDFEEVTELSELLEAIYQIKNTL